MEKKDLENILNELLKSIGYKKKGNNWILKNDEVTKIINLQKSKYSSRFYINYGFILNSLPIGNLSMHIFNGVGSQDKEENEWIKDNLDFENNIPRDNRILALRKIIDIHIIKKIEFINSKEDIRTYLVNRSNLNDISLNVRQYLDIS